MAEVVMKFQKETTTLTSNTNTVILTPTIQKQVKNLREGRNLGKQAKEISDTARENILESLGEIAEELIGTDAKGKRLLAVKVIKSSEVFDWERLMRTQPELYQMLKSEYVIPRGEGKPTLRLDIL